MGNKMCFATFVAGDRYKHYIPFYLYFARKEYPEYFTTVYYTGALSDDVLASVLRVIDLNKCRLDEITIPSCFRERDDYIKIYRWLHFASIWKKFDGVYLSDVDLFPIRETPTLLDRKLALCDKYSLPYYNTAGIDDPATRGLRMTGIHFFKPESYRRAVSWDMNRFLELANSGFDVREITEFFNPITRRIDNQHFLWNLIRSAPSLKIINDPVGWEYNGIHLGHSRDVNRWRGMFKEDPVARGYWSAFDKYLDDSAFNDILENTIPEIKREFETFITAGQIYGGGDS